MMSHERPYNLLLKKRQEDGGRSDERRHRLRKLTMCGMIGVKHQRAVLGFKPVNR